MFSTATPFSQNEFKRARPLLGTIVRARVAAPPSAPVSEAINNAFAEGERLARVFSKFDPQSELNRWQSGGSVGLSAELAELMQLSQELFEVSGGAFNPRTPDGAGYDLSGIAKGYIADRMAELLADQLPADSRGEINAGGDLRFFGPGPHPVHLRLLVANDPAPRYRQLSSQWPAVATSSVSESQLNPDSSTIYSQPLRSQLTAFHNVTVLAPSGALADALTKVALFGDAKSIGACLQRWPAAVLVFGPDGELQESWP